MKESGESRREKQRGPVSGAESVQTTLGGVTGGAGAGLTLQNSERGIRDMLETMHLAAVQLDTEGRVSYCSEYLCALTGWTREEILGQDWFEKFIPAELQEEMRRLFTAIHNPTIEFPKRHENDILTRSGERRLVLWSNNVLRDQENHPVGVTAIGQDITERRQAEEILRRSAQVSDRLRSLSAHMNSCKTSRDILELLLDTALEVCRMDAGGVYLIEDGTAELVYHRGLPGSFVAQVQSIPMSWPAVERVLASELPLDVSSLLAEHISTYRNYGFQRVYSAPLRAGTEVLGFLNVVSSRTGPDDPDDAQLLKVIALETAALLCRLRADEALRDRERQYRATLDAMTDAIHVVDRDLRVVLINAAFKDWMRSLGLDTRVAGRNVFEVFPFLSEHVREEYARVFESGKMLSTEETTEAGGQVFATITRKIPIVQKGAVSQVLTVIQDVTQKKKSEDLLRQSEERYRNILESIQEGYYEVNLHGDFTFFNEPLCRIFGYAPDEMMGMNYHQYYRGAEAIARVRDAYQRVFETGQAVKLIDWRVVRKDGSEAILTVSVALVRDREGNPCGFRGIARDVTEHRQAAQALEEAETRYRELFENANDIIYTHDLDGRFTSLNKAGEQISGYTQEEARHLNALEILAPKYREMARDMVRRKIIRDDPTRYEAAILAKDGRIVPLEISTRLMVENGKPVGIQGIARDITERKTAEEERRRLEAQIQHTQKLEGLGVLAGGIAHDFNNLLVGIMGNAGLALSRLPEESPARNYVRRIEETSQRAAELTNQMLAYSGRGTFLVRALDLSKLAQEMGPLLTASISKKAVLRYDCTPELPLIKGDVAQLHQIMMNLITNASDALGDHAGVIGISTYVMHVDRLYLKKTYVADDLVEGPYVCLAVSDTGCGMSPDTLARMFDPFFSTKFAGRGLGLAAVLGIVRGHKGAVTVYSEPGQGTTFKVLFPVAECVENGAAREHAARMDPELAAWRGEGTILVADDESAVLDVAQEALEQHGLRVLTARDGREAMEVFQAHVDTVSAVLLDLMMPVINGGEAADLIHALNPDVPVILTSGYTEQDAKERFQTRAPVTFIQKPYRPQDLVRVIREVMTNRPPNS